MRTGFYQTYPLLRREYTNLNELSKVINRSKTTVFRRLSLEEFTPNDKRLIAEDLIRRGKGTNAEEIIKEYFGG